MTLEKFWENSGVFKNATHPRMVLASDCVMSVADLYFFISSFVQSFKVELEFIDQSRILTCSVQGWGFILIKKKFPSFLISME